MSRLQAPGFSKVKPSGLPRASILSVPSVPSSGVCKRTDSIETPNTQISEPKRSLICKPVTNSVSQHGPTPYERISKLTTSQIPNIGKRRSMGALKIPDSRVLKDTSKLNNIHENIMMPKEPLKRLVDNAYNPNPPQENAFESCILKPPLSNNNLRKLTTNQLKQPSAISIIPQNPSNQSIAGAKTFGFNYPNKLPSKAQSKSLQMLPAIADKVDSSDFVEVNKSLSQDDLISSNISSECSSKINTQNTQSRMQAINKSKLNLKGQLSSLRPRISTHVSCIENMSTPYNTVQSKHLEYLKISPIVSEPDITEADSTFSVFKEQSNNFNTSFNKCSDEQKQDQCDNVLDDIDNDLQNITYNHEKKQDIYKININCNRTVNLTRNIEEKEVEDFNTEEDQHNIPTFNKTQILDYVAGNLNETFGFLDETRVINGCKKTDSNCNKTQVILDDENDLFIENEKMPKNVIEDSPGKINHELNEFESQNESFSDDIQKVLAAISNNDLNDPNVELATSGKTHEHNTFSQNLSENTCSTYINNDICNAENEFLDTSVDQTNIFSKTKSETSELIENVTEINLSENIKCEKTEVLNNELDLDCSKIKKNTTPEIDGIIPLPDKSEGNDEYYDNSTKTPVKKMPIKLFNTEPSFPQSDLLPSSLIDDDEEFTYGIDNRCYTISMGDIGRKREASNSKLRRSQTYGPRDFAYNFRPPKQMQMTETLEGNIMMDNTSFLHFTNEIKLVKTQLLKLKRTLLETDYFSPLMKGPLKLSNYIEGSSIPPLSPRLFLSSPMAVVDPLVVTENTTTRENIKERRSVDLDDDICLLTQRFQNSLQRIEELEKEIDCKNNTIKLLQLQLENYESKEQDILEENIFLREEVSHLNERLHKMQESNCKEMNLSASFEEFNIAHLHSRKTMLNKLYSNGSSD